jgi:hypothetical protein
LDPAAFTQLCERWGGDRPNDAIRCGPAIEAALTAIGAGQVERVEFRYAPICDAGTTCPPRDPHRAWIIVRSGGANVAITTSIGGGGIIVGPTTSAPPAEPLVFQAPPHGRADIAGPQPAEVRDRPAFALCGTEVADPDPAFEVAARRCFLDGVLSGNAVEFVTIASGTEGGQTLTLYRFTGHGGVVAYDRDGGRWTRTICGIAPQSTDVVFLLDGLCERRDLSAP